MSMPAPCEGGEFPRDSESEALLVSTREGIIQCAAERLDEAMALEDTEGRVYVSEAPVATPTEEVATILLTKDGIRPFQEEADTKEQLILYFPADTAGVVWIDHIKDGAHMKFSLDKFGLEPYVDPEELLAPEAPELEPTLEAVQDAPEAIPVSDMTRLSSLREKIERFLITPLD